MTTSFLSLSFYYTSTRIHEKTPLFKNELEIMGLNIYQDVGIILVFLTAIYTCGLIRHYCCNPKAQTKDEERGDVVINREENYEGIFVNPPQEQILHQPVPSYTPTSLRSPHDTELPAYKPMGTPPPCYVPGLKDFQPDSTQPSPV